MLDVPYGTQVDGATWHPAVKTHLYVGRALSPHLAPYAPGPYTLGRFIENTLNPGNPTPSPEPTGALEPRRIQFEAADAIAARSEKVSEFREKFANPYIAAAHGFIDEVIRPRDTRRRLITALRSLQNKRDRNPPKKHGNIPL